VCAISRSGSYNACGIRIVYLIELFRCLWHTDNLSRNVFLILRGSIHTDNVSVSQVQNIVINICVLFVATRDKGSANPNDKPRIDLCIRSIRLIPLHLVMLYSFTWSYDH